MEEELLPQAPHELRQLRGGLSAGGYQAPLFAVRVGAVKPRWPTLTSAHVGIELKACSACSQTELIDLLQNAEAFLSGQLPAHGMESAPSDERAIGMQRA